MRYHYSCLIGFNCIFQLYKWFLLYHDMDKKYHVTLCFGQLHPMTFIGLVFGCELFWWWTLLCVPFKNSLIARYSIKTVATIIGILCPSLFILTYMFRFSEISCYGSTTTHLAQCFCPRTVPLNIGLNMLPSGSIVSCLDPLLGYSTCEFHALQLIVLWCWEQRINHVPPVC